jgi:hypothetical protein
MTMNLYNQSPFVVGTASQALAAHSLGNIKNDGTHYYATHVLEATSQLPADAHQEVILPLTSTAHDITELHKTAITLIFNITLAINSPPFEKDMFRSKKLNEPSLRFESMKGYFLFFGLKNGSDVLRSYQLMHRGKPVGNSLQTQGTITSFLMNLFLDKQSKENNGCCHSCWQNVMDDNG